VIGDVSCFKGDGPANILRDVSVWS